jgi:hypothetical protein
MRAILFADHEDNNVVQWVCSGALYQVYIISDYILTYKTIGSPHQYAYKKAVEMYDYLYGFILNGRNAGDYTLEEIVEMGKKRHYFLFKSIEEKYNNGLLNMSFDDLKSTVKEKSRPHRRNRL